MSIIEKRTMSLRSLCHLCTNNNWYTSGEWLDVISMVRSAENQPLEMTTERLVSIARKIIEHSDLPASYDICCMMNELAQICKTTFEMK